MKKKIGIIVLLIIIAAGCFAVGQINVKRSLFSMSDAFEYAATEYNEEKVLYLTCDEGAEGSVDLGSSYVTLSFDYEIEMSSGETMPEDANLQIDITCPEMPENSLQWAFEPGKMQASGSMDVDLKTFKGKEVDIKFTCKGNFEEGCGIILKDMYVSKMYIGN